MSLVIRVAATLAGICLLHIDCALALADGYYDSTWAGGGRITFAGDFHNPGYNSIARQVVLESNGNLLLGGDVADGTYWWLGELAPGGTPILTFGESNNSGLITSCHLSVNLCSAYGFSEFALQSDGRIDVTDGLTLTRTTANAHARDAAGVSGGTGSVALTIQINNHQGQMYDGYGLAPASSGKWILAGNGSYNAIGNPDFAAVRLNADLSLDTGFNAVTDSNNVTFAGGQIVPFDIGGTHDADQAQAAIVQGDGRIVLAGSAQQSDASHYAAVLARLNPGGSLDTTFGGGGTGKVVLGSVNGLSLLPRSIKADRAGRLLVASRSNAGVGIAVARLSADGIPDPAFPTAGVSTLVPSTCIVVYVLALAIDSAGRILVAGECDTSGPTVFLVARLRGDHGTLDTSFGIGGYSYGAFDATSTYDSAKDIIFDGGGQPVVSGFSFPAPGSPQRAGVARLTYDLIYTNNFETTPRGCLPPDCN